MGVSSSLCSKYPSWKELLTHLLAQLPNPNPTIKYAIALGDFTHAATLLSGVSDNTKQLIADYFSKLDTNLDQKYQMAFFLKKLFKSWKSLSIITTNYDNLLQTVLTSEGKVQSWDWTSEDFSADAFSQTGIANVFHIHGTEGVADLIVFDYADYNRVRQHVKTQKFVQGWMQCSTFVFIGCGSTLQDANFGPLLRWGDSLIHVISFPHYLIGSWSDISQKALVLRDGNYLSIVRPIPYEEACVQIDIAKLPSFLSDVFRI